MRSPQSATNKTLKRVTIKQMHFIYFSISFNNSLKIFRAFLKVKPIIAQIHRLQPGSSTYDHIVFYSFK